MAIEITGTEYGNWVSTKFVTIPLLIGTVFLGLALVWPGIVILAVPCLLAGVYFVYARHAFSPRGGNIQVKLWGMVLDRLTWDGKGKALDIGCGNGPLTIALAQRHPHGHVTGIDTWVKAWDYSKAVCERNAKAAGVAGRTDFERASASALPFEDEVFDAAVSNTSDFIPAALKLPFMLGKISIICGTK